MTPFMIMIGIALAFFLGLLIGILQEGINITINYNNKPLAPKKQEEQQYTQDFSHLLPPEMQKYFTQNSGYIK